MTRPREARLTALLRELESAGNALPDGIVLVDAKRRVRWWNAAAAALLGLAHEHRGAALASLWPDTELARWLAGGADEALPDVAAPVASAPRLSAELLGFGARRHLLLVRDISHINRLEQTRRDFVANVSHELRTPLTVIHGYLELLDADDVPALAPVLAEMRAQSRRMGQIVEDLLTLARLETQLDAADEQVPMRPLLSSLQLEAEALSQGRHRIALAGADAIDLRGSPRDLHSAFSNLVSNAVRYTPTAGSIDISWRRRADGGAEFQVRDTGYGIPATHLARLTERFYRVSSSRSRETGGTGLGLSIVKHVLGLHQAALRIDSTPGRGSTFTCVFGPARVVLPGRDD